MFNKTLCVGRYALDSQHLAPEVLKPKDVKDAPSRVIKRPRVVADTPAVNLLEGFHKDFAPMHPRLGHDCFKSYMNGKPALTEHVRNTVLTTEEALVQVATADMWDQVVLEDEVPFDVGSRICLKQEGRVIECRHSNTKHGRGPEVKAAENKQAYAFEKFVDYLCDSAPPKGKPSRMKYFEVQRTILETEDRKDLWNFFYPFLVNGMSIGQEIERHEVVLNERRLEMSGLSRVLAAQSFVRAHLSGVSKLIVGTLAPAGIPEDPAAGGAANAQPQEAKIFEMRAMPRDFYCATYQLEPADAFYAKIVRFFGQAKEYLAKTDGEVVAIREPGETEFLWNVQE